jgi:predicted chitinase
MSGGQLDRLGPMELRLRRYFANDFLSPLIGATLFLDFSQAFIPVPLGILDRARALEYAFERAESDMHSGDRNLLRDYFSEWTPQGSLPALLINTTDAASGRRVMISPFDLHDGGAPRNAPLLRYQGLGGAKEGDRRHAPDIRLSTAAGISARFPWVTPAATVSVADERLGTGTKIRLVDGGYVDNSGVETAIDLINAIRGAVAKIDALAADPEKFVPGTHSRYPRVRVRLIALSGGDYAVRGSYGLGDLFEPLRALLSTRSSRAYVALNRASQEFPAHEVARLSRNDISVSVHIRDFRRADLINRFYPLPLGWAMSNRTRQIIEKQSGHFWNCEPDIGFNQSQRSLSETDCIQLLVYHELNRSVTAAATDIAAAQLIAALQDAPTAPERVPHNRLIECYRDEAVPGMTRRQAQALEALLRIWDRNTQWGDDRILAFVLGTLANETGNFRLRVENLSFKSAERIKSLWPSRFPTVEDAVPFVNNPQLLAEKVYGDRFGNRPGSGDAWRYRGRGMAMLHGRGEYDRFGKRISLDLLENPEWASNPSVGARIAFHAYFSPNMIGGLVDLLTSQETTWDELVARLQRVVDRGGIAAKSELFHRCIAQARSAPAAIR